MPASRIQDISAQECLDLLDQHHVGRLAFLDTVGLLPLIIPVNYILDDDTVVFRTDPGAKLTAAIHGAPVAFEVDGLDPQQQVGWSVVARGRAAEVTDPAELTRLREGPLVPWAPGAKSHYVRVHHGPISGRRISVADLPSNWWG